MELGYVTKYGSLRHQADKRLDAMALAVVHASVSGLKIAASHQDLEVIAWNGPDRSGLIISVEGLVIRTVVMDLDGDTALVEECSVSDTEGIRTIVETGVDFLISLSEEWDEE